MRIGIVGAGLSGLATAFYLKQARPDWDLVIMEARARAGGTLHTEERQGFRFEAGGNGFLTSKPDGMQLVESSGAQSLLLPSSDLARKRFIYTDRLQRLPESPGLFVRSRLLTLPQKLRLLGEFLVPPKRDEADETLQEFGYRRVGKAFTDVFLDAMCAGIYGTTPDKLSVKAAFPLIVALERDHGGLFRGMLARRKREAGPGGILMSFRQGISTFIEHLQQRIEAEWHLGTVVRSLEPAPDGYRLTTESDVVAVDQVVLAAPAFEAATIVESMDMELAAALRAFDYSPIAVVGFGYRQLDHPLDGFGLLTITSACQPILGVLWDSSIFPDRAPTGAKSLRVLLGGQRNPELVALDEQRIVDLALTGVRNTMGVTQAPDVVYFRRWERGIPSYARGHVARVDAAYELAAKWPGLHLNCNAYRGVAINDCCRNSRLLAERIVGEAGLRLAA